MEPDPEKKEDVRSALLCSVIANYFRWAYSKERKMTTLDDFMINWFPDTDFEQEEKPKQSIEDMKSILLSIASATSSRVKKR